MLAPPVPEATLRKSLYHSPWGLLDFQAKGCAYCILRPVNLATWSTGIGKTHLGMGSVALLFEDGLIDHCLVVCEQNKLQEWMDDLAEFTELKAERYYGSVKRRTKLRQDLPQVLVSTYETVRNDAGVWFGVANRKSKKLGPGPLIEALVGKRVIIIYDEILAKLSNRKSALYKVHDFLVQTLREYEGRVIGLTGMMVARSPENSFNVGRILDPTAMPTVAKFEKYYVADKDIFGNFTRFKNLTPEETEDGIIPFQARFKNILLVKRKTDPDVKDQFPEQVEEFRYVELDAKHQEFYDTVVDTFADADEWTQRKLFVTLRQIAGHPEALLMAQSEVARTIVDAVGAQGLMALGAAKLDRMIDYLRPIVLGEGLQAVVFTFFRSMFPPLARDLGAAGIEVVQHHGRMTQPEKEKVKAAFKAGDYPVLLTTDTGSRGLNLPQASYVVNYEAPMTHFNYIQRIDRVHRIDSKAKFGRQLVTAMTFVALDTVEEGVMVLGHRRNEWEDKLLPDDESGENFLTAIQRKNLTSIARKNPVRKVED